MILTWEQQQTLGEVVKRAVGSAQRHGEPLNTGHIAAAFSQLWFDKTWAQLPREWSIHLYRSLCPDQVVDAKRKVAV